MEGPTNVIDEKEKFINFVKSLSSDLQNHPEEWENRDLSSYFEAMASWIEDMEGYYENMNLSVPQDVNWQFLADVLIAAKMYE